MSELFSWEQNFKKSWEKTKEIKSKIPKQLKEKYVHTQSNKGLIRHLNILIDFSPPLDSKDYLPSTKFFILNYLKSFVKRFYQENPISILSISGFDEENQFFFDQIYKKSEIEKYYKISSEEQFFLIDLLENVVLNMNDNYIKEVLVITNSISSKYKSSDVITKIQSKNIKIHFISLSGEVTFFKNIAKNTMGTYFVPLDEYATKKALNTFIKPFQINSSARVSMIRVGFPKNISFSNLCQKNSDPFFCICHLKVCDEGYECPSCTSRFCNLPFKCTICDLQLISSLTLAKSVYFYKDPLNFIDINDSEKNICRSCEDENVLSSKKCQKCNSVYCGPCCDYSSSVLRFCMFCL